MEKFRIKRIFSDGSHNFKTLHLFMCLSMAVRAARANAECFGVSKVDLYQGTKLVATFYH